MHVIPPVRVKVSCVRSPEEARRAVQFGADAIGVALQVPPNDTDLGAEEIVAITAAVPDDVGTFLLTALDDPVEIADMAARCGVNTVQLWDALPRATYAEIRRRAPDLSLAQTIHVVSDRALAAAREYSVIADALVLASTNPAPPYRWDPPHGRTHDWRLSAEIAATAGVPVILSGGLTHQNVADAIRLVRPYGVEVCSGVREGGALDTSLLVQFLESLGRVRPS